MRMLNPYICAFSTPLITGLQPRPAQRPHVAVYSRGAPGRGGAPRTAVEVALMELFNKHFEQRPSMGRADWTSLTLTLSGTTGANKIQSLLPMPTTAFCSLLFASAAAKSGYRGRRQLDEDRWWLRDTMYRGLRYIVSRSHQRGS
jgi:hypothetical protein